MWPSIGASFAVAGLSAAYYALTKTNKNNEKTWHTEVLEKIKEAEGQRNQSVQTFLNMGNMNGLNLALENSFTDISIGAEGAKEDHNLHPHPSIVSRTDLNTKNKFTLTLVERQTESEADAQQGLSHGDENIQTTEEWPSTSRNTRNSRFNKKSPVRARLPNSKSSPMVCFTNPKFGQRMACRTNNLFSFSVYKKNTNNEERDSTEFLFPPILSEESIESYYDMENLENASLSVSRNESAEELGTIDVMGEIKEINEQLSHSQSEENQKISQNNSETSSTDQRDVTFDDKYAQVNEHEIKVNEEINEKTKFWKSYNPVEKFNEGGVSALFYLGVAILIVGFCWYKYKSEHNNNSKSY